MGKTRANDRKPLAVLISDVHYSLGTLALADGALRAAIDRAAILSVPLVVAGDLHDTKANLRGECVKVILDTYEYALDKGVSTKTLIGNHDLINERGEEHSLEFLRSHTELIQEPTDIGRLYFIPYQANSAEFERILATIPKGQIIIMHQGVTGAASGEYAYDKSAIRAELLADYRVISGHYHRAQDIKTGRPQTGTVGLMSYIGSPYTITFAEANDGPKGFQVLYDDGLLEQVPLKLRKHVIIDVAVDAPSCPTSPNIFEGDLVWVKLRGPALALDKVKKAELAERLFIGHTSFKLDKILTNAPALAAPELDKKTPGDIMDIMIDKSEESPQRKADLKKLWRELV